MTAPGLVQHAAREAPNRHQLQVQQVGYRHADGPDAPDESLPMGMNSQPQQQGRDQRREEREAPARHASRPLRWSATRSALAMMVSPGFTAALDGKKLPSTT